MPVVGFSVTLARDNATFSAFLGGSRGGMKKTALSSFTLGTNVGARIYLLCVCVCVLAYGLFVLSHYRIVHIKRKNDRYGK